MGFLFWFIVSIFSFWAILKGSEIFLRHAEKLGGMVGINSFIVGAVIIGFGTSLPELVSSVAAVAKDAQEFVIPTIVGSNITNILLIMGLASIIGLTIKEEDIFLRERILSFVLATVFFAFVMFDGTINQVEAMSLFILGIINVFYFLTDRRSKAIVSKVDLDIGKNGYIESGLGFVIGLSLLTIGSNFFIQSILEISSIVNIAVGVLSTTIVALGTSLPEIAVSIRLALKNKVSELLGTILGSNIFNVLIIGGIAGILSDLTIVEHIKIIGLAFLGLSGSLIISAIFTRSLRKIEGVIFIALYLIFIIQVFG